MKEICIITSYFPPETGAASNRMYQLSKGLQQADYKVTVITPLPNYPTGKIFSDYKGKFQHKTEFEGICLHRLWLYASNSKNKLKRLVAMLSYSFSLCWYFMWHKIPKTVVVQSPPLLVAFTCVCLLKSHRRKLILNVSDLWPIAGLELGALKDGFYYRLLQRSERYNYKNADLIVGQSQEILDHIKQYVDQKPMFLYRNYPVFEIPIQAQLLENTKKIKLVYAGLLGVAQGVLKLCKNLDYTNIEFHIYGSGSESFDINKFAKDHPELPIKYHGQLSREELHIKLLSYDLAIIPLLKRIYGSVPSKIFEYARLGLPMLYFGGGEGESLVNDHKLGWVVEPGDYFELNKTLNAINFPNENWNQEIRLEAQKNFDFESQLNQFLEIIQ